MATVSDIELEQKTEEYANFVNEYFIATNKESYKSSKMVLYMIEGTVFLEHKGR